MFQEHIDSILEGLPPDYHFIIAIIESKFEPLPIEQVEALLAHEARLNKFTKKHSLIHLPSIIRKHNTSLPQLAPMDILCQTRQIKRVSRLSVADLAVVVVLPMAVVVLAVVVVAVVAAVVVAGLLTSSVRCVSNLFTLLLFAITTMINIINQLQQLFTE